jgi:hypothetical protein
MKPDEAKQDQTGSQYSQAARKIITQEDRHEITKSQKDTNTGINSRQRGHQEA